MIKLMKLLVNYMHPKTQNQNLKDIKDPHESNNPDSNLDSSSHSEWLSWADENYWGQTKQYEICYKFPSHDKQK